MPSAPESTAAASVPMEVSPFATAPVRHSAVTVVDTVKNAALVQASWKYLNEYLPAPLVEQMKVQMNKVAVIDPYVTKLDEKLVQVYNTIPSRTDVSERVHNKVDNVRTVVNTVKETVKTQVPVAIDAASTRYQSLLHSSVDAVDRLLPVPVEKDVQATEPVTTTENTTTSKLTLKDVGSHSLVRARDHANVRVKQLTNIDLMELYQTHTYEQVLSSVHTHWATALERVQQLPAVTAVRSTVHTVASHPVVENVHHQVENAVSRVKVSMQTLQAQLATLATTTASSFTTYTQQFQAHVPDAATVQANLNELRSKLHAAIAKARTSSTERLTTLSHELLHVISTSQALAYFQQVNVPELKSKVDDLKQSLMELLHLTTKQSVDTVKVQEQQEEKTKEIDAILCD